MTAADQVIQSLNYDFNEMVYLFNNVVDNVSTRDKNIAIAWVNNLKTAAGSVQEARVRNDFMYYLVRSCHQGHLQQPFREKPPKGPLLNLMSLLPQDMGGGGGHDANVAAARKTRPDLYEATPGKGAFLAAQPVPMCGAFCYLAVISKPKDK